LRVVGWRTMAAGVTLWLFISVTSLPQATLAQLKSGA
jgi:hypothetical protein